MSFEMQLILVASRTWVIMVLIIHGVICKKEKIECISGWIGLLLPRNGWSNLRMPVYTTLSIPRQTIMLFWCLTLIILNPQEDAAFTLKRCGLKRGIVGKSLRKRGARI